MRRKRNGIAQILALLVLIVLPMAWYLGSVVYHAAQDHELIQGVRANDLARVRRALDAGANPNARESSAISPSTWQMLMEVLMHRTAPNSTPVLMIAILGREANAVTLLVQRGANPNLIDASGAPILMDAIVADEADLAATLLQHGANPNTANSDGDTALMWAANRHGVTLTEALLAHGADPNAANHAGQTPLIWAVGPAFPGPLPGAPGGRTGVPASNVVPKANDDVVKALLAHGANPSARDTTGNSVLVWAAQQYGWGRSRSLAPLLIAHGADVTVQPTNNQFAFKQSCQVASMTWAYGNSLPPNESLLTEFVLKGDIEAVRQLVARGVDVNARYPGGVTALVCARDPRIRALLLKAGAKN